MADVELIIKISEHNKNIIDRFVNGEGFKVLPTPVVDAVIRAVRNGKPLPKGHGDLIDRGKLSICPIDITDLPQDKYLMVYLADDVNNAETIIRADKGGAE